MNPSDSYRRRKLWNCLGCGRRSYARCGTFFVFPKDPTKRKIWLKKCNIDPSSPIPCDARLCNVHFSQNDFIRGSKKIMLKKSAVPKVTVKPQNTRPFRNYKVLCYVCGMMYAEYHSFHKIPCNIKVREQWMRNLGIEISNSNPVPSGCIYLCDSHFSEEDFIAHPYSIRRRLRRGAMPRMASSNCLNRNDNGSFDSSKREGSDAPKRDIGAVTLNDCSENEIPSESKRKSSNKPKGVAITSAEITSSKRVPVPDKFDTSFLKHENITPIIDLTDAEDTEGSKRLERLEKKKERSNRELTDYQYQEPPESRTSKVNRSSQYPKSVAASSANNISGKRRQSDDSSISFNSKKENITLTVNLTVDEKKRKRLRRLKKKIAQLKKKLTDQQNLFKNLLEKKSSQYADSKAVAAHISGEGRRLDDSKSSSSKEEDITFTIDLTQVEDTRLPKSEIKKKRKPVRRLKKKISQVKKELTDHHNLLNYIIEKKLVTKAGKKMIKKFRKKPIIMT